MKQDILTKQRININFFMKFDKSKREILKMLETVESLP